MWLPAGDGQHLQWPVLVAGTVCEPVRGGLVRGGTQQREGLVRGGPGEGGQSEAGQSGAQQGGSGGGWWEDQRPGHSLSEELRGSHCAPGGHSPVAGENRALRRVSAVTGQRGQDGDRMSQVPGGDRPVSETLV